MLYLAGFIVILHTVMPHSHYDPVSSAEQVNGQKSTDGLIDHIKLMLNTDMGDGHLEHFESGHGPDLDLSTAIYQATLLAVIFDHGYLLSNKNSYIAIEHYLKDDPFPDQPIKSTVSLRGPPIIS